MKPEAPQHLSAAAKAWFSSVAATFRLEPHHVRLLTLAAESWDEGETARKAVAEHGITFVDRYGQPRERPEVGTGRQARITFARLLRELALDISPPVESRPPRTGGRKH